MKALILTSVLLLTITLSGCAEGPPSLDAPSSEEEPSTLGSQMINQDDKHLTIQNTVGDVIKHPSFQGFGHFILPLDWGYEDDLSLSQVSTLLPYHNNMDSQRAVDIINSMIDKTAQGETIFYNIYSAEEKQANPDKENTGLFFFRGEPDAPFAIICPGGGFSYVGSIHEGFPHAMELSQKGYNAFVIQYRVGGADVACEDLAAAISFVFSHTEELGVRTEGYSLWGGSAGARMAAYLGSYGPGAFGGDNLPKPGTVVMQYTGHTDYTDDEPPTFVVVGENDGIASWRTMQQRLNTISSMGVDTEFHKYSNLGHGFGLGIGTTAEGWLDLAVQFWEKQLQAN